MAGQTKDTQSKKYQLTINNPNEKGLTHEKIFEILKNNFKTLEYLCMADEQGNTFHTHVFVCFHSKVRFSMIKSIFHRHTLNQSKALSARMYHTSKRLASGLTLKSMTL